MIVFRTIAIVSFLLLSACAERQAMISSPNINSTPLQSREEDTTTSPSVAAQKQAQNETHSQAEIKLDKQLALADSKALIQDKKVSLAKSTSAATKKSYLSAAKISSWDLSGAMAARNKSKGWSASVHWVQRGAGQYQIRLSGPLGSGTVLISRSGGTVTLRDGPKTVSSSNAEFLLKKQTGVSLPVGNLYYWVRGLPAPGAVSGKQRDEAGRLLVLKQDGYTIQYQQYTSGKGIALPSSIRLQGNGVFIKLVIKRWQI